MVMTAGKIRNGNGGGAFRLALETNGTAMNRIRKPNQIAGKMRRNKKSFATRYAG